MNLKSCIAAAAIALVPMLSHAGIVYNWQLTNKKTPIAITFSIEFEKSAVKSGDFSLQLDQNDLENWTPRPDLGLVSFSLGLAKGTSPNISYFDRQIAFGLPLGSLDMDVGFGRNGVLSGYIRSSDFQTSFYMESTKNGRFEMLELRSDALLLGGCGFDGIPMTCSGITGVIRRAEVPEPSTLALFGVGILAAFRMRHKKRTT